MEVKKIRVFVFQDGKGKPIFMKSTDTWSDFCQLVVKEFFAGVGNPELKLVNEKKEKVASLEKLLSEKDPLIYLVTVMTLYVLNSTCRIRAKATSLLWNQSPLMSYPSKRGNSGNE